MENIAILGSTGSIGRNSLEVMDKLSHRFRVVGPEYTTFREAS
jgi:1-deoxy-D-xylulose-5-phosphate reductoisomerase